MILLSHRPHAESWSSCGKEFSEDSSLFAYFLLLEQEWMLVPSEAQSSKTVHYVQLYRLFTVQDTLPRVEWWLKNSVLVLLSKLCALPQGCVFCGGWAGGGAAKRAALFNFSKDTIPSPAA